jgi:hypothetical protein
VRPIFVELDVLAEVARLAVDPRAAVTVHSDQLEQKLVVLTVNFVDRRPHFDLGAFRQRQDVLRHLVRRPNGESLPAHRAVRRAHGCEQHAQIVGNVGHRADRGARVRADGLLVDRHDRRQAVDEVDVGFLELADESFGERRHRREQAPLSLGVHGVERQRRLAGAAHAGDDDEPIARNL